MSCHLTRTCALTQPFATNCHSYGWVFVCVGLLGIALHLVVAVFVDGFYVYLPLSSLSFLSLNECAFALAMVWMLCACAVIAISCRRRRHYTQTSLTVIFLIVNVKWQVNEWNSISSAVVYCANSTVCCVFACAQSPMCLCVHSRVWRIRLLCYRSLSNSCVCVFSCRFVHSNKCGVCLSFSDLVYCVVFFRCEVIAAVHATETN